MCIRSGGTEEDLAHYLTQPGVDMVSSKSTMFAELAAKIGVQWWARKEGSARANGDATANGKQDGPGPAPDDESKLRLC